MCYFSKKKKMEIIAALPPKTLEITPERNEQMCYKWVNNSLFGLQNVSLFLQSHLQWDD